MLSGPIFFSYNRKNMNVYLHSIDINKKYRLNK